MINSNNPNIQQALIEDALLDSLGLHDGIDRFQRTRPSVPEAQGPHVWAENPRKPHAGKMYIPVRYVWQEFPKSLYQKRMIPSVMISSGLDSVIAATKSDKQEAWNKFMDLLVGIELDIDFRQLALPSELPDATALRLLKRTLILQVQAAESEAWRAKHQKTYEEYKLWAKTPQERIVYSKEEQGSVGRGWFTSPDCTPQTEVNRPQ